MLDCKIESYIWLYNLIKSNMIILMIISHFIKLDMDYFYLLIK